MSGRLTALRLSSAHPPSLKGQTGARRAGRPCASDTEAPHNSSQTRSERVDVRLEGFLGGLKDELRNRSTDRQTDTGMRQKRTRVENRKGVKKIGKKTGDT